MTKRNHPVKALEQPASTEASFIIHDNEKSFINESTQKRTKNRVIEQVKNGTDVILVTSAKHGTDPITLESLFVDSNDEIRTICLNSHSFEASPEGQPDDLSMISAVVYESIHLDSHFAIIVDNADQIPIPTLNELIKLALGINTSKNNVNFLFSGGPGLLGVIQQISDITRLSLVHCSMDVITEEDIQEFIDLKQNHFADSVRLHCNKYALKKISNLANGSLQNASVLLEWIRLYALHINKFKITVGMLDELFSIIKDTHLLSNYPPQDYQFTSDSISFTPEDSQNIEFVKPEKLLDESPLEIPEINTIYIENDSVESEKEEIPNTSNVYEKVMHKSDLPSKTDDQIDSLNTNNEVEIETPTEAEESNIDEDLNVEIEAIAVPIKTHGVLKQADTSFEDFEYQDTYHSDTLKHINDPFTFADEDLPLGGDRTNRQQANNDINKSGSYKFFSLAMLLLVAASIGFFAWKNDLIDNSFIESIITNQTFSNKEISVIESTQSEITTTIDQLTSSSPIINNIENHEVDDVNVLINLAHQQIEDKKLTTPAGDNAYETFRSILLIEPRNKAALAGIEKIINRYTAWAKLDIKDNNIKRARYFLTLAMEINPDDREIKELLLSLDSIKTSSLN